MAHAPRLGVDDLQIDDDARRGPRRGVGDGGAHRRQGVLELVVQAPQELAVPGPGRLLAAGAGQADVPRAPRPHRRHEGGRTQDQPAGLRGHEPQGRPHEQFDVAGAQAQTQDGGGQEPDEDKPDQQGAL